jgi:hypothetical protein
VLRDAEDLSIAYAEGDTWAMRVHDVNAGDTAAGAYVTARVQYAAM